MKKRVISAVIMILLLVPILIIGGYPYIILMALLGLLGLKELLNLEDDIPLFFKVCSYLFTLFLILSNCKDTTINFLLNDKVMLSIWLFYFISIVLINNKKYQFKDSIYLILITMFIGISFKGFIIVRNIGIYEIAYLFLIASLTDTFALFSGKYFGKRKLSAISPKKTIEGSVGGSIIGTVLSSIIYVSLTGAWDRIWFFLGVSLVLSVLGQIGDLFFSSIKRYYKLKDFSDLIPGHGGILDRLDSVIFILLGYIIILM